MAHRALLLVDLQNDFCAGGALAVPEGDSTVDVANALIDWSPARGEPIVASRGLASGGSRQFRQPAPVEPYTEGELDGLGANFLAGSLRAAQRRRGAASSAQAAGDRRCVPQRAKPEHRQL